jgi:hypothetical protein
MQSSIPQTGSNSLETTLAPLPVFPSDLHSIQSNTLTVNNVVIAYYYITDVDTLSPDITTRKFGYKYVLFNFTFSKPESVKSYDIDSTGLYTTDGAKYNASWQGIVRYTGNNEWEVDFSKGGTFIYQVPDSQMPLEIRSMIWFKGKSSSEEVLFPLRLS